MIVLQWCCKGGLLGRLYSARVTCSFRLLCLLQYHYVPSRLIINCSCLFDETTYSGRCTRAQAGLRTRTDGKIEAHQGMSCGSSLTDDCDFGSQKQVSGSHNMTCRQILPGLPDSADTILACFDAVARTSHMVMAMAFPSRHLLNLWCGRVAVGNSRQEAIST
jgi:hypothetical protein